MRRRVFSYTTSTDEIPASEHPAGTWLPVQVPSRQWRSRVRRLEGRQVSIVLKDGTRLDGCTLVSAGRNRTTSLWLVADDLDAFLALDDVLDVVDVPDAVPEYTQAV
jgi:hypothetical protein